MKLDKDFIAFIKYQAKESPDMILMSGRYFVLNTIVYTIQDDLGINISLEDCSYAKLLLLLGYNNIEYLPSDTTGKYFVSNSNKETGFSTWLYLEFLDNLPILIEEFGSELVNKLFMYPQDLDTSHSCDIFKEKISKYLMENGNVNTEISLPDEESSDDSISVDGVYTEILICTRHMLHKEQVSILKKKYGNIRLHYSTERIRAVEDIINYVVGHNISVVTGVFPDEYLLQLALRLPDNCDLLKVIYEAYDVPVINIDGMSAPSSTVICNGFKRIKHIKLEMEEI